MKRLDKNARRKLRRFCVPALIVQLILVLFAYCGENIFKFLFGLDVDIFEWVVSGSLLCIVYAYTVYAIIAIKQKCWEELAIALVVMTTFILCLGKALSI